MIPTARLPHQPRLRGGLHAGDRCDVASPSRSSRKGELAVQSLALTAICLACRIRDGPNMLPVLPEAIQFLKITKEKDNMSIHTNLDTSLRSTAAKRIVNLYLLEARRRFASYTEWRDQTEPLGPEKEIIGVARGIQKLAAHVDGVREGESRRDVSRRAAHQALVLLRLFQQLSETVPVECARYLEELSEQTKLLALETLLASPSGSGKSVFVIQENSDLWHGLLGPMVKIEGLCTIVCTIRQRYFDFDAFLFRDTMRALRCASRDCRSVYRAGADVLASCKFKLPHEREIVCSISKEANDAYFALRRCVFARAISLGILEADRLVTEARAWAQKVMGKRNGVVDEMYFAGLDARPPRRETALCSN